MENLIKCVLIRGKTSSFARVKQKHSKKNLCKAKWGMQLPRLMLTLSLLHFKQGKRMFHFRCKRSEEDRETVEVNNQESDLYNSKHYA